MSNKKLISIVRWLLLCISVLFLLNCVDIGGSESSDVGRSESPDRDCDGNYISGDPEPYQLYRF